jgi:serine/threonine protein kinase
MAPEQFLHHDLGYYKQSTVTYSAKVDIYGFGITCYEILTGKLPFDDMPTKFGIMAGHRSMLPHDVDGKLRDLTQACWNSDP